MTPRSGGNPGIPDFAPLIRATTQPLQPQIAQRWMIVGTAAKRPMILALALLDRQVVDAGEAQAHQAVLVEFPVFIAVAAEPVAAVVMAFVSEPHRDAVLAKGPHFLDQTVVQFAAPLARQKRHDGLAALKELRAITPAAVDRIGQ